MNSQPICARPSSHIPFGQWSPKPLIGSSAVLDLDETKVRVLSIGVFPVWEIINSKKHRIKSVKMFWLDPKWTEPGGNRKKRGELLVEIVSVALRGGEKFTSHMIVWLCPENNPSWIDAFYGPTETHSRYGCHPHSECHC